MKAFDLNNSVALSNVRFILQSCTLYLGSFFRFKAAH